WLIHGFCVGRIMISLIKLFGSCVTIIRTACAMSSGLSIRSRDLPEVSLGEKRVSVDPGQITDTRMPYARTSSASDSVNPTTPNFDAQYTARFAEPTLPAIEATLIMCPRLRFIMDGSTNRL